MRATVLFCLAASVGAFTVPTKTIAAPMRPAVEPCRRTADGNMIIG